MRRLDPDDAFADQVEWLNHRYDPGYFLGGTLRPELRLSLGANAKRVAGVLAFVSGLGILGILVGMWVASGYFVPEPWSLSSGILSLLVGRRMWKSAEMDGTAGVLSLPEEVRRFLRVVAMTSLGAGLIAVACLALLWLVGGLVSLFRGQVGIPTSIGILLITVFVHRARASVQEERD
jgi:hypothetical protein